MNRFLIPILFALALPNAVEANWWGIYRSKAEAKRVLKMDLIDAINDKYDCIIFAVAHSQFKNEATNLIEKHSKNNCVIYDLKRIVPKEVDTISL